MTEVSDALFPLLFLKTHLCTTAAPAPCHRWVNSPKQELTLIERSFHNTVSLFPVLQQWGKVPPEIGAPRAEWSKAQAEQELVSPCKPAARVAEKHGRFHWCSSFKFFVCFFKSHAFKGHPRTQILPQLGLL